MKKWLSDFEKCDICGCQLKNNVEYFVDGKTKLKGLWGLLCPECHKKYGYGLGCGFGQKYDGKTGVLLEGGCDQTEGE